MVEGRDGWTDWVAEDETNMTESDSRWAPVVIKVDTNDRLVNVFIFSQQLLGRSEHSEMRR